MNTNVHPQELVKIAINVEEAGKELYGKLEQQATQPEIKEIWRYLKDQEVIHKGIFENILAHIGDYVVFEVTKGEYDSYLRAIASNYIFTYQRMQEQLSRQFSSDIEALDFGIEIEKDSILTYMALKEYVVADKQNVVDKVIQEEKNHLARLTRLKQQLLSQE